MNTSTTAQFGADQRASPDIGDAIIAGIASGGGPLEQMSEIVSHLERAGFAIVPATGGDAVAATPSIGDDWSCAADFLDDIEVDAKGMCRWADVANAQTHIRHSLRSVQPRHPAQAAPDLEADAAEHGFYRDALIEECARLAESLHGVEEGDIPQHVFAGHRIAKAIRALSLPSTPSEAGK